MNDEVKGETLVLPDIGRRDWNLSHDEQVRCLSFLIRNLSNFAQIPEGLKGKVVPVPYPSPTHLYPGISLYDETGQLDIAQIPHPFEVEERINSFLQSAGKSHLLRASAGEELTWQDVLNR